MSITRRDVRIRDVKAKRSRLTTRGGSIQVSLHRLTLGEAAIPDKEQASFDPCLTGE